MKGIFHLPRGAHQVEAAHLALVGMKRLGLDVDVGDAGIEPCDFAMVWGWRLGAALRAKGLDVLVFETGYVGDRLAWLSLGWNGLNGRAEVPATYCDGGRWRNHFDGLMQPWRKGGEYILIAGQVPGDAAVAHIDLMRWYRETAKALQAHHGLPVKLRAHPNAPIARLPSDIIGVELTAGDAPQALGQAAWVVTFNSNFGVDAVLAGVPAVACDEGSMIWELCGHEAVSSPTRPDRDEWAAALAWRQWSHDEIASGDALDVMMFHKGLGT